MRPNLKEFAQILVEQVRDRAIQMADINLRPESKVSVAERWRAAGVQRADVVIPDVVDATVFAFLSAIDQELLKLVFVSKDGTTLDLPEEGYGELGGRYMTSGGWREEYSKERFVDDLSRSKDSGG